MPDVSITPQVQLLPQQRPERRQDAQNFIASLSSRRRSSFSCHEALLLVGRVGEVFFGVLDFLVETRRVEFALGDRGLGEQDQAARR